MPLGMRVPFMSGDCTPSPAVGQLSEASDRFATRLIRQASQSLRSGREVDNGAGALRFANRATKVDLEGGPARGCASGSCFEHGGVGGSAGLGAVKRSVGQSHQLVRLGGGRGKEGKATGAGQTNAEWGHVERRREYRLDFLTQGDRLIAH